MIKIKDINLPTITKNALIKAGIEYLDDMPQKYTMLGLARLPCLGRKGLHALEDVVKKYGLPEIPIE